MRFKKKCLVVFFSVLILTSLVGTKAMAVDTDALRVRIAALQAQIAVLVQQLADATPAPAVWCHDFHRNLKYGNGGTEVRALQTALQKEGFYTGAISGSFDQITASAVVGFQQKYHKETLAPWGLKYGTGFVGGTTRAKLTAIYGCSVTPTPVPIPIPIPTPTPVPTPTPIPVPISNTKIQITAPEDGKVVTGSVNVRATAKSSNRLGDMYLTIAQGQGAGILKFHDCSESAAGSSTGYTAYTKSCSYNWQNFYNTYKDGKITFTAEISDNVGINVKDSVTVTFNSNNECVAEGGIGYRSYGNVCCEGLAMISNSRPSGTVCIAPTNTSFVCSYCGNGVCGFGENSCNCPADCATQTEENLPPVIDGLTAPTQLKVNQQGTWKLEVNDPENGYLSYAVRWGDRLRSQVTGAERPVSSTAEISQISTFRHTYNQAGTYTIRFTVTDDHNQSVEISTTVKVVDGIILGCTDTDGGKNYYQKGSITTYGNIVQTDYCPGGLQGRYLKEYYCANSQDGAVITHLCPDYCVSGACITRAEEEPSITVTSPNGGEEWAINNSYNIIWQSSGIEKVDISLCEFSPTEIYLMGNCTQVIAKDVSASLGAYSWTVISDIVAGKYKIRVRDSEAGTWEIREDESDDYFGIVEATTACTDTDGGKDYYTAGIVTTKDSNDISASYSDYCYGSFSVKEYFCLNQGVASDIAVCPNNGSCKDGACAEQVEELSIKVLSPNGGEEWVIGEDTIIQWSTSLNPNSSGSFIALMKSDGSDMVGYIAGVISNNQPVIWDSETVWYSRSGTGGTFQVQPGTYRIRIGILDLTIQKTTIFVDSDPFSIVDSAVTTCTDTDGGKNYDVLGGCSSGNMGAGDYCAFSSGRAGTLKEAYCSSTGLCIREDYICPQGKICRSGKCVTGYASDAICQDTDGGTNMYVQGTLHSKNLIGAEDSCYVSRYQDKASGALVSECSSSKPLEYCGVYEYYCSSADYSTSKFIPCPGGCYDGACAEQVVGVGSLYISLAASTPLSQNVEKGATDLVFSEINFDVDVVEDIKIGPISVYAQKISDNAESAVTPNDVTDIAIYDGNILLSSAEATVNNIGLVTFSDVSWIIPKGTSKVLTIKADILSTTNAEKVQFLLNQKATKMTGIDSGIQTSIDGSDGTGFWDDSSTAGNWMTIIESAEGISSPCGNYGDVDGDGFVTQADSDLVLNYGVGNITLTSEQIARADVSGNGTVSAYDSALILQYIDGTITTFSVCALGGLNNVENQLANIATAIDRLMKNLAQ